MNELNVIVKLYEKYLHKTCLDNLHLVRKAILLIPASVNKSFTHINNWL